VIYEFPDNVRAFVGHRQVTNSYSDVSDHIAGTTGFGEIKGQLDPQLNGKEPWHYEGPKPNMYQVEHNELFAGIRSGKLVNDGEWMAQTTLMAIMGRMAAYTGKEITWEQAMNSEEKLVPDSLDWNMKLDIAPMAMPGVTKVV
jgi:myo-inositol 2-dehydrogenase/D-chiro-inositol 1-dehydrogenase